MNQNRFYFILVVMLLAVLLYLQYGFWLGKNNYFEYKENQYEYQLMKNEVEALKSRNAQMIAEIKSLKTGKEAIEERAIHDFDMIYPDEQFFRIIDMRKSED